ncbi:MAG: helix-turn-helix domain-containing protein [Methyloligella sp. ZOD6]
MTPVTNNRDRKLTHGSKRLRVCDFLQRGETALESSDDTVSANDILIEGQFLHQELRRGLVLHASNAIEEKRFTATSSLGEGLSCVFFLEGKVDVKIGGRDFEFQAEDHRATTGAAIVSAQRESFQRASAGRQHVRHLVVSATTEWLDVEGLEEVDTERNTARLLREHLTDHRWTLSPRVLALVDQIFSPSVFTEELRRLYLESRAVEIVAETISAVTNAEPRRINGGLLERTDLTRLRRAKDLIEAKLTEPLTVQIIAREAGVSPSGLQRLFRLAEGVSVFEYVRRHRLERAFDALSAGGSRVQEASVIAGYTNPANFATAFRRQYGLAPREIRWSLKSH